MSNTSRPRPYVGVSGVVDPGQQRQLVAWAQELELGRARRLLLGVKAVHKTQFLDVANKYGTGWYPVGETPFAGALEPALVGPDRLKTVGAAQLYLDVDHVGDAAYRSAILGRVVERGSAWLQALQFDLLPWHSNPHMRDFLAGLREDHGELEILLQCHGPAMAELGPAGVAAALGALAPYVDHVLLDSSHGTGRTLEVTKLDPFLDAVHSAPGLDSLGFGIAGGLDAPTVQDTLPQLLASYPGLSWDAEGRLRVPGGDGRLDLERVRAYLRASAAVLPSAE